MTKLSTALLGLALAFSTVDANPLWGVWYGEHPEAVGQGATFTFRSDGTFEVEMFIPRAEAAGLFMEMFGDLLYDLDLNVEGLVELGVAMPTITHLILEGPYTVEGDFLTASATGILLGSKGAKESSLASGWPT